MRNILYNSLLIILASLLFVINDALINYLSPIGIKFYHFVFFGTPAYLLVPIFFYFKGELKDKLYSSNYFIPLLRGIIFLPLPFIAFITLKNMTLPEYTTLNMSAPIFAGLMSFFYLKEKINIYLILSILIGIIGVCFVIQPGFNNFNLYFLLVLFGAFLINLSGTLVNKYAHVTSSIGFFIYGGVFAHILSLFLFILDPISVSFKIFLLITFSSIFINLAIFIMVYVYNNTSKYFGSISCLLYIQILWSVLIGFFIFNENLNTLAFVGAILIILSGIFSVPAQYKQFND